MNPHCDAILELLAAESSFERPWSAPLEGHLQGCERCAAFAGRLEWTTGKLRELQPIGAPSELHGRVVSACHSGFAEDRAVARLAHLMPVVAPPDLDRAMLRLYEQVEAEGVLERGVQAPEVLAKRVETDLKDLPKAVSRHTLKKLPRLETPELLRDRLGKALPATSAPAAPRSPRLVGRWTALVATAAAAGLVWMIQSGPAPDSEAGLAHGPDLSPLNEAELALSFEVVRPLEFEQLSPVARSLAARVSGGVDFAAASANRVALESGVLAPGANAPGADDTETGNSRNAALGAGPGPPSGSSAAAGQPGAANPVATVPGPGSTQGGPAYFAGSPQAHFSQSYRGIRDVTIHVNYLGVDTELVYREEVASDGAGSFTVEPLQVVVPVLSAYEEDQFLTLQSGRKGFFFQHRDFRVRDANLFWENYKVQDLGMSQVFAGRTCDTLQITRKDGIGNQFIVAIDPLTSLVMMEQRNGKDGSPVSRVQYQSFDLSVDLSDLQLSSTQSGWTTTDEAGLSAAVSGDLLIPVAPPQGFELLDLAYRTDAGIGQDETWVQLTYGDGVEQAFFLFHQRASQGNAGSQSAVGGMDDDLVRSLRVGPWSVLDGRAAGRDVVAVGRVTEDDLLLMLQSALR